MRAKDKLLLLNLFILVIAVIIGLRKDHFNV